MAFRFSHIRHGRTGIRLLCLSRPGDRHEVRDLAVDIAVDAAAPAAVALSAADRLADGVHALARDQAAAAAETFALAVARYALEQAVDAVRVRVDVRERVWARVDAFGRPHDTVFTRGGPERRTARVVMDRTGRSPRVHAGLAGLRLLRTAGPAAGGAAPGGVTAVRLDALWRYGWGEVPFTVYGQQVRRALLIALAEDDGGTAYDTLVRVARATLEQCPPMLDIRLRLAAAQHPEIDMTRYGMENTGEVFAPAARARVVVEARLRRDELA